MSSPAWLPQDVKPSVPGETQQGSQVAGPSTTLASPTAAAPAQGLGLSTRNGPSVSVSDAAQESAQTKFVSAPGYAAPSPSFSYNVVSKASTAGGSSQQSSSPIIKSNIPASVAALQPPVPSQTTGPSFSYNIITHNTLGSSGGMQFQSSTNTSASASQEARTSTSASSNSQSVLLPTHPPSTTSATAIATPNMYRPTMRMPSGPSFPGHPAMPGTPGPPGMPPFASLSSTVHVRPIPMDSLSPAFLRPIMPSTASLPLNPTLQQQTYPPYTSVPTMASSPQGLWLQPPQLGGLHRPPFLPYPAGNPGPSPLSVRGMNFSSPTLPDSYHPHGVSPLGPPGGTSMPSVGSTQPLSSLGMQSDLPPPGIDNNRQANGDGVTVNNEVNPWTAHKTDTGAVYYYNAVTGKSTYEKPSGFTGETGQVTLQPTPVSSEKLAGTDWVLVTTNDGKKYYYNTKSKVSSWQIPSEVTELRKKQEADLEQANAMSVPNASLLPEKESGPISLNAPALITGGRDAAALRPCVPGSSSALDLIKKKLQDSGLPAAASPLHASSGSTSSDVNGSRAVDATSKGVLGENIKEKQKDANGDENVSDSSSDSEDEDSGPTKEECIIQFKEMLKERGVAPFSKWEKELPKIVFDQRFKAVPGYSTRRSLFEHYVRTRAEEERKEKRAAQKAAVEGFKQLLEEASEDIDQNTDYQSFKKKWGSDPRFEALDRKERELLLNERILPLKKAAEEKIRAVKEAAASSFKSMLRDKGDINTSSRWSRVKDGLRNDPRYKSVKHEDREILFNDYIAELKAAEEEANRILRAKREEQDKLKEREREMRKRKERDEQEMERVRVKVRRKEAVSSYQSLLVETIRDPQASWTESKPKLEKDPQGRATNSDLDKAETEKLFREHVKILYERCARGFQALLSEVITAEAADQVTEDGKTVLTSWSTAKRLLKSDPRYSKMPRKERESLWRRYAEEMQRKQKLSSDPKEDKLSTDTKGRSSLDSGRSPAGSRKHHGWR